MEKLAKEYFWVIHLTLLSVMAFLSARVATYLLAEEIVALPTTSKVEALAAARAQKKPRAERLSSVVDRNLFNATPPEATEPCEGPDCAAPKGDDEEGGPISDRVPAPHEPCKDSDLKMGLAAIMMAEPSAWSVAIFESDSGDRVLKEGQAIADLTLAAIQRQRVVLNKGNRFECLALKTAEEKGGKEGARGAIGAPRDLGGARPGAAPPAGGLKGAVRKTGQNQFELDRDAIVAELDKGNHLRSARALPSYKNGKSEGIKIVGIRPGSIYSELGIRSGDVIKAVGDEEITSPTSALRMFDKIKDAESITIEVQRNNRPTTLEYILK